ncbi:MAG: DUF72 domain-containing protein [Chloroflexi bacterium]|nr:DUF72 domain-containing protein [Chloroflexota bacterium]
MAAQIFVGTSSWNEQHLIDCGRFYPLGLKDSASRLSFYAQRFNLAEVDSTYYALPSRRNADRWATAVSPGFRFIIKVFSLFSQHPTKLSAIPKSFHATLPPALLSKRFIYHKDVPAETSQEIWRIFRNTLEPLRLAGVLGAILVDFPPWFMPSDDNRTYIAGLRANLPDDNILVQFRAPQWVADDATTASTLSLLSEAGCGFAAVDEPQGLKSSFPPTMAATASVSAIRFLGRNVERWEDKTAPSAERFNWWYSDEELAEWLPRIQHIASHCQEVYLSFSTKSEDQGVVNAGRLQRLLGLKVAA